MDDVSRSPGTATPFDRLTDPHADLRPGVIVSKCESTEASGMARTRLEFLVFVAATLLTSQIAAADTFVHAKVTRSAAPTPECFSTTATPNQGVGTGCEIAGDSGFAPVGGAAFAIANGVELLGTSARLYSENSDGGSWQAIGYAEATDTLRISAFGRTGTQGVADFLFTTHTTDTRDSVGLLDGTMGVISEMQVKDDGDIRLIHSLSFPRTLPPFTARVFFVYGESFELTVSLESKVSCSLCTGRWNGISDASNTAELQIIHVQGLDQEQFRVESLLGNTYANVVPVPELRTTAQNIFSLLTIGMLVWYPRRSNGAHS
jgi:hypothetical protein